MEGRHYTSVSAYEGDGSDLLLNRIKYKLGQFRDDIEEVLAGLQPGGLCARAPQTCSDEGGSEADSEVSMTIEDNAGVEDESDESGERFDKFCKDLMTVCHSTATHSPTNEAEFAQLQEEEGTGSLHLLDELSCQHTTTISIDTGLIIIEEEFSSPRDPEWMLTESRPPSPAGPADLLLGPPKQYNTDLGSPGVPVRVDAAAEIERDGKQKPTATQPIKKKPTQPINLKDIKLTNSLGFTPSTQCDNARVGPATKSKYSIAESPGPALNQTNKSNKEEVFIDTDFIKLSRSNKTDKIGHAKNKPDEENNSFGFDIFKSRKVNKDVTTKTDDPKETKEKSSFGIDFIKLTKDDKEIPATSNNAKKPSSSGFDIFKSSKVNKDVTTKTDDPKESKEKSSFDIDFIKLNKDDKVDKEIPATSEAEEKGPFSFDIIQPSSKDVPTIIDGNSTINELKKKSKDVEISKVIDKEISAKNDNGEKNKRKGFIWFRYYQTQ